MSTTASLGRTLKLKELLRRRFGRTTIIVGSAEGSRFDHEDKWDENAQEELDRLYDETLASVLSERAKRERSSTSKVPRAKRSS